MTVRVTLFPTCLGDQLFAEACADAVRLLRHFGAEVTVPDAPACCGQPAYNAGDRRLAGRMARHTRSLLKDAEHVVLPSGSCTAMLRCSSPKLLGEDVTNPDEVTSGRVAPRAYELSEFLTEVLGVDRLGAGLSGRRVAYHHGCHALRELRSDGAPVALLRACGADVVAWSTDRECCGFGGLFSAKLPEVSAGMADRKLDTLPKIDFVTSADPGCLLQLSSRAARRRDAIRFRHLASVLWEGVIS